MTDKVISEPNKSIKVAAECDVVVVGGGPGGIGAAVSAARNGVKTVLIERYGHLGGMGTGGLVTIIPCLSDFDGNAQIAGLTQEWIDRLDKREACSYPRPEVWGADDNTLLEYWNDRSFFTVRENRVVYSTIIDAEISKCILDQMVNEAGIKTYLDAWGTMPLMEGNKAVGVVFESKSGRQAILADVVVDATGDGDIYAAAGAAFEKIKDTIGLVSRMGNVTIQDRTIPPITRRSIAPTPRAKPTPITQPTAIWVVDTGRPVLDASTTVTAAASVAQ